MKRYTVYVDENLQATDMGPYQREGLLTSLIILTKKIPFNLSCLTVKNGQFPFLLSLSCFCFFKEITQAYCQTKKGTLTGKIFLARRLPIPWFIPKGCSVTIFSVSIFSMFLGRHQLSATHSCTRW